MQVTLNTRITVALRQQLDTYCQQSGESIAGVVETALAEYLAKLCRKKPDEFGEYCDQLAKKK